MNNNIINRNDIEGQYIKNIVQTPLRVSEEFLLCDFYVFLTNGYVFELFPDIDELLPIWNHNLVLNDELLEINFVNKMVGSRILKVVHYNVSPNISLLVMNINGVKEIIYVTDWPPGRFSVCVKAFEKSDEKYLFDYWDYSPIL